MVFITNIINKFAIIHIIFPHLKTGVSGVFIVLAAWSIVLHILHLAWPFKWFLSRWLLGRSISNSNRCRVILDLLESIILIPGCAISLVIGSAIVLSLVLEKADFKGPCNGFLISALLCC